MDRRSLVTTTSALSIGLLSGWFVNHKLRDNLDHPSAAPHQDKKCSNGLRDISSSLVGKRVEYHSPNTVPNSAEINALTAEVAKLQRELGLCQGDRVSWPSDLESSWSVDDFQDRMNLISGELDVEGDIEFYCEEFPCIAQFPDATDLRQLKSMAEREFGGPDVAGIRVHSHGIIGEHGKRRLPLIAVGPATHIDEFVEERLDDRFADIIQSVTKELKLAGHENSK